MAEKTDPSHLHFTVTKLLEKSTRHSNALVEYFNVSGIQQKLPISYIHQVG